MSVNRFKYRAMTITTSFSFFFSSFNILFPLLFLLCLSLPRQMVVFNLPRFVKKKYVGFVYVLSFFGHLCHCMQYHEVHVFQFCVALFHYYPLLFLFLSSFLFRKRRNTKMIKILRVAYIFLCYTHKVYTLK